MKTSKFLILFIVLIVYGPAKGQLVSLNEETKDTQELMNKSAPNFEAVTLSNKPFELLDLRGKIVVLYFWSLRCAACFNELIDLNEIARKYSKNVIVISVMDDNKEKLLRAFEVRASNVYRLKNRIKIEEINFQIIPDGNKMILTSYAKEKWFSQTFFIDANGIVKDYSGGYSASLESSPDPKGIDQLCNKIDRILSENH